ncbi:MAG: hypothetical protein M9891_16110 [Austwickia sp.]|nr:hypothetical protein [Actinomycetota bacterium]MCB1254602.1 hypothetical protein [Austwickia sp.]MCO5310777.1 hypothetical protein [Austwickia sp.]
MLTTKKPWDEVQAELLDVVFYAHDPSAVLASADLAKAGMLDSLSVVAIIEVLAEATGADSALDAATVEDFASMVHIHDLYERL